MHVSELNFVKDFLSRSALCFSMEQLERIRNTRFAIAGLGGVGAIVAELVARWGVKRVRLFDKDRYEVSNLNRQIFATTKTIGSYKVDVACERIKEINPHTEVEMVVKERSSYKNVLDFLKGVDILIQTTDSPSSLLFYRVASKYKIPLINGYSTITGGCVSVYDYKNSPCYTFWEKMKDLIKWNGKKDICEMTEEELDDLDNVWGHKTAPTINFVTNMVGCLIVSETIKLITGMGKGVNYPYQIEFDLFSLTFKKRKSNSILRVSNYKKFLTIIKNKMA